MEQPLIEEVDEEASKRPVSLQPLRPLPKVSFADEGDCVTLKFPIPNGVVVNKKVSGITVDWTETRLKVAFADDPDHPIISGALRGAIRVPASTASKWGTSDVETRWLVENGSVFVLQLEKQDKQEKWPRLFSMDHYATLAEAGDLDEQVNQAMQAELQRDEQKAFYWWKKAADSGNAHSQFNVGKRYRDGVGVARDEEMYQKYLVLAAVNVDPDQHALLQVGIWLKKGELLDFGKTALLGRSYRDLWDRAVRKLPTSQAGGVCGQQLLQEYHAEQNYEKAKEYAMLIGLPYAIPSPAPKARQTAPFSAAKAIPQRSREAESEKGSLNTLIGVAAGVVTLALVMAIFAKKK